MLCNQTTRSRLAAATSSPILLLAALIAVGCGGCSATNGYNQAGVAAFNQGNYAVALSDFQMAADSNPLNADAVYNMARVHHDIGTKQGSRSDLDRAEAYYNQALDIDRDHVGAHRALAVLLVETGREDSAFKLMQNWTQSSPQVADARIELARLYEEFGDKQTALLHLNQALAIDGSIARIHGTMGKLREEMGQYDQALANYERSLQLDRLQPQANMIAARIGTLRQATSSSFGAMAPNGTRTVTPVLSSNRY